MKSVLKFLRDWTLPVSMLFGTLMYLLFAYTPALEEAAVFFDPIFELILPWFMFLVLFVTFCKVDFHKMRPVAWHGWNILVQLLTVALIVAVILYFHLQGNDLILMESALTCVIAPCATAAAVVTSKLGEHGFGLRPGPRDKRGHSQRLPDRHAADHACRHHQHALRRAYGQRQYRGADPQKHDASLLFHRRSAQRQPRVVLLL